MTDRIRTLLSTSDRAVVRALTTLYGLQTADEQQGDQTVYRNARGFNAADAEILSSFARQVHQRQAGGRAELLSPRQLVVARRKLAKYAGQLARLSSPQPA